MSLTDLNTKKLFSTHNMLIVIGFFATATFGMFVWDAERAIAKLDSVTTDSSATAALVSRVSDKVDDLRTGAIDLDLKMARVGEQVADHEKRISIIEAVSNRNGAHRQR